MSDLPPSQQLERAVRELQAAEADAIQWEDGRHSYACKDHLQIDPTATVKPARIFRMRNWKKPRGR